MDCYAGMHRRRIAVDLFQSDRDHPSIMAMSTENELVLKEYENSFDQMRLIRRKSLA